MHLLLINNKSIDFLIMLSRLIPRLTKPSTRLLSSTSAIKSEGLAVVSIFLSLTFIDL